jgi:hypothetical protein
MGAIQENQSISNKLDCQQSILMCSKPCSIFHGAFKHDERELGLIVRGKSELLLSPLTRIILYLWHKLCAPALDNQAYVQ